MSNGTTQDHQDTAQDPPRRLPDWMNLPDNLPEAVEQDKSAFHLLGHPLPALIELTSTAGGAVDLFLLSLTKPVMLFLYPKTSVPGQPCPPGWDQIVGARGCTSHLCSVKQSISQLRLIEPELEIFGLSTQTTEYQRQVHTRLHLPFPLLSDADLRFAKVLDIPTFSVDGEVFFKRMTLLLRGGQITRIDYPISKPDQAAERAKDLLIPEGVLARFVDERDRAQAQTGA